MESQDESINSQVMFDLVKIITPVLLYYLCDVTRMVTSTITTLSLPGHSSPYIFTEEDQRHLAHLQKVKAVYTEAECQSGKSVLKRDVLQLCANHPTETIVAVVVTQNFQSLAAQLHHSFNDNNMYSIVRLASDSKDMKKVLSSDQSIIHLLTEYKRTRKMMPVFLTLNNKHQFVRIMKIIQHVRSLGMKLMIIFDEADATYLAWKAMKPVTINERQYTFMDIIQDQELLFLSMFITATEGVLMKEPEVAQAYVVPRPKLAENYRGGSHPDLSFICYSKQKNHKLFVEHVLEENKKYFKTPYSLPSGERYYKKIIIESSLTMLSHHTLACWCVRHGFHALTFNSDGISLFRKKHLTKIFPVHQEKINEMLFYIYKMYNLNDKPLVIIGNRKIDRGIGFSYAPFSGEEGLIWTDLILPDHKKDVASAVQVAGRSMGNIGHCPQYPGKITIHTTLRTSNMVKDHCDKTGILNTITQHKTYEAKIATDEAKKQVELIKQQKEDAYDHVSDQTNHRHRLFASEAEAIDWSKRHLGRRLRVYDTVHGAYNSESIQRQLDVDITTCPTQARVLAKIWSKLSDVDTVHQKTLVRKIRVVEGWLVVWKVID
jgi:hypothetical protein